MHSSYVFQRLYLQIGSTPRFEVLRREIDFPAANAEEQELPEAERICARLFRCLLTELPAKKGIVCRQYCPDGDCGRMFFSPENALKIDTVLLHVRSWLKMSWISELEAVYLLSATMDGADRVANISGTYAAYLKKWQVSSTRKLSLRFPKLVQGPEGRGHRENALTWLPGKKADLIYLDPPYNHRQYPANYNLMEILARIPFEEDIHGLEKSIYGVAGLIPWQDRSSSLCSRRGDECFNSFSNLIDQMAEIPRLILSYSEEGILSRQQIEDCLARFVGCAPSRLGNILQELSYKRFRSDTDGNVARTGSGRKYQQLPGRKRDEVKEWLFAVKRK